MSFHELTGDYPWLTKRMATSIAMKRGSEVVMRLGGACSPGYWPPSFPRFGMGEGLFAGDGGADRHSGCCGDSGLSGFY